MKNQEERQRVAYGLGDKVVELNRLIAMAANDGVIAQIHVGSRAHTAGAHGQIPEIWLRCYTLTEMNVQPVRDDEEFK
jgi:hypothetical protein